jgi:hypothetical protein
MVDAEVIIFLACPVDNIVVKRVNLQIYDN